jgi:hypothetical protein
MWLKLLRQKTLPFGGLAASHSGQFHPTGARCNFKDFGYHLNPCLTVSYFHSCCPPCFGSGGTGSCSREISAFDGDYLTSKAGCRTANSEIIQPDWINSRSSYSFFQLSGDFAVGRDGRSWLGLTRLSRTRNITVDYFLIGPWSDGYHCPHEPGSEGIPFS